MPCVNSRVNCWFAEPESKRGRNRRSHHVLSCLSTAVLISPTVWMRNIAHELLELLQPTLCAFAVSSSTLLNDGVRLTLLRLLI